MPFEPGCHRNRHLPAQLNARQHGVGQREQQAQELLEFRYRRVGYIKHVFVLDRETLNPKQAAWIFEIDPVDPRDQTPGRGYCRLLRIRLSASSLRASRFEPE